MQVRRACTRDGMLLEHGSLYNFFILFKSKSEIVSDRHWMIIVASKLDRVLVSCLVAVKLWTHLISIPGYVV